MSYNENDISPRSSIGSNPVSKKRSISGNSTVSNAQFIFTRVPLHDSNTNNNTNTGYNDDYSRGNTNTATNTGISRTKSLQPSTNTGSMFDMIDKIKRQNSTKA